MFAIIGIVVVFGAIAGGYLMEHGNLKVLMQPAELLIIGGASIGTVLIANPLHILMKIVGGVIGVFTGSKFSKKTLSRPMKMMFNVFNKARKEGLMALKADVEDPGEEPGVFQASRVLEESPLRDFLCDTHAHGDHRRRRRSTWIN